MFFRLLFESFRRQRRRKLLAGVAVLLGSTTVAAMLSLATTIGDRIHRELAVYGANIVVTPQADALAVNIGGVDLKPASANVFLHERDLGKLRTIFWSNNITGVSPELTLPALVGQTGTQPASTRVVGYWFDHDLAGLRTGAPALHPWWKLTGAWPQAAEPTAPDSLDSAALGSELARHLHVRIGDTVSLYPAQINSSASRPAANEPTKLRVVGIVSTGDRSESQVFMTLSAAQAYGIRTGLIAQRADQNGDAVTRVDVSARTRPEDAFARQNPETLSPKQRDVWYCRPYANSIAFQIREALPGADAQQVRQVEQNEGKVLARISGLMWLVSIAALVAAGFAVSAAIATAILERQAEIGLMRSLGASRVSIALLFYVESGILAVLAGTAGFFAGCGLAGWLGTRVFSSGPGSPAGQLARTVWINPVLLPIVLALAVAVALLGSTPAIRRALDAEPSAILRAAA